jgi:hypothetical protein
MRRTIPLASTLVVTAGVLTYAHRAHALEACEPGMYCCTETYYTPAHFGNVAAGDIVLQGVTGHSTLSAIMNAIGEQYSHALMVTDNGGFTRSDTTLDIKAIGRDDLNCRLDEGNTRSAPPGIQYGVNVDQTYLPNTGQAGSGTDLNGTTATEVEAGYDGNPGQDLVLVGAGNPSAQSSDGYHRYHMHAFVTKIANAHCAQLVHDSFSPLLSAAPGLGYSNTVVLNGANGLDQEAYNMCMGFISSDWSVLAGLWCGSIQSTCQSIANQVVNEMLFDCDSCVSHDWSTASSVPTIPGGAAGPNSPWSLGKYWTQTLQKPTRVATTTNGYFTTVHDALCP